MLCSHSAFALLLLLLLHLPGGSSAWSFSPSLTTTWTRFRSPSLSLQEDSDTHILVLPGFGTSARDYQSDLVPHLQQQCSHQVHVVPIERSEWIFRTLLGGGLLDLEFWKGTAAPLRPAYRWYLERVASEVRRLGATGGRILLVGHSAGGWLGRASLGYAMEHASQAKNGTSSSIYQGLDYDLSCILGIVTLGTPHQPPPMGSFDLTGGALRVVHEKFPGAYFKDSMIYVTAAGRGRPSRLAQESYKLLSGLAKDEHQEGDGIVPVPFAHLEGALQLTLDNVQHASHLISSTDGASLWYGSKAIVQQWMRPILPHLSSPTKQQVWRRPKFLARWQRQAPTTTTS